MKIVLTSKRAFGLAVVSGACVISGFAPADLKVEDRSITGQPVLADLNVANEQAATKQAKVAEQAQTATQATYELLLQIENLSDELGQLRGLVEEQAYQIHQMRGEQKERYINLDQRVVDLTQRTSELEKTPVPTVQVNNASPQTDRDLYRQAKGYLLEKEYVKSIATFNIQLEQFPQGEYAPYAHYWLGEVYLALEPAQLEKAKYELELVKTNYPKHIKYPAALYKLAMVYHLSGNVAKARLTLNHISIQFPDSPESKLAQQYLKTSLN